MRLWTASAHPDSTAAAASRAATTCDPDWRRAIRRNTTGVTIAPAIAQAREHERGLNRSASCRRPRGRRRSRGGRPSACRDRASTSGRSARSPGPSPTAAGSGKKIPEMPAITRTGNIPQEPTFCTFGTSAPMIIPSGSVASGPRASTQDDRQPAARATGHHAVEEQEARHQDHEQLRHLGRGCEREQVGGRGPPRKPWGSPCGAAAFRPRAPSRGCTPGR